MTVIKPENDTMDYRILTLENGLKVALVSDAECDKAAAALDVNVGYFQDPEHAPGLAHFLEHMCFYASEKYPKEDEFMKFTQEHGGSTNAYVCIHALLANCGPSRELTVATFFVPIRNHSFSPLFFPF